MLPHKSEDYKFSAVQYYLSKNKNQVQTCEIFQWELYEKGGINTERLYDFLEKHIVNKYKNKLIIMDNTSSHRHQSIKDLVNK